VDEGGMMSWAVMKLSVL